MYKEAERTYSGAAPIELYLFRYGTQIHRYTSAPDEVVLSNEKYIPMVIERSNIERTTEINKSSLTITAEQSLPIAQLYKITPPSSAVTAMLTQFHETDQDSETVVLFSGRILAAAWKGSKVELSCENIFRSLRRSGIRRFYQLSCPHVLYGNQCRAQRIALTASVATLRGNVVTLSADIAGGGYAGGSLEWKDRETGGTERRMVVSQDEQVLTLAAIPKGLHVGSSVKAFQGCKRNLKDCLEKFNNVVNFGGFPWMPEKNPFGDAPMY